MWSLFPIIFFLGSPSFLSIPATIDDQKQLLAMAYPTLTQRGAGSLDRPVSSSPEEDAGCASIFRGKLLYCFSLPSVWCNGEDGGFGLSTNKNEKTRSSLDVSRGVLCILGLVHQATPLECGIKVLRRKHTRSCP